MSADESSGASVVVRTDPPPNANMILFGGSLILLMLVVSAFVIATWANPVHRLASSTASDDFLRVRNALFLVLFAWGVVAVVSVVRQVHTRGAVLIATVREPGSVVLEVPRSPLRPRGARCVLQPGSVKITRTTHRRAGWPRDKNYFPRAMRIKGVGGAVVASAWFRFSGDDVKELVALLEANGFDVSAPKGPWS